MYLVSLFHVVNHNADECASNKAPVSEFQISQSTYFVILSTYLSSQLSPLRLLNFLPAQYGDNLPPLHLPGRPCISEPFNDTLYDLLWIGAIKWKILSLSSK